jgi:hypothetical protein
MACRGTALLLPTLHIKTRWNYLYGPQRDLSFMHLPIYCRAGVAQSGLQTGRPSDRGSIPGGGKRSIPLASVSRPALGPTQPPVQCATGVFSRGVKCDRGVTLTTYPHLVPRLRMSRSYISSPYVACMAIVEQLYIPIYSIMMRSFWK